MNKIYLRLVKLSSIVLLGGFLTGCATTGGQKDPMESMNRSIFDFNEKLDKNVLKPVASGYKAVTPDVIEPAVGNFFSNLNDVVVIVNDVLQLKFTEAGSDSARFLINTLLGIGGTIDFATDYGFLKRNEDFGQTLGHYGVPDGAYMVLPVVGANSARDMLGGIVDSATSPIFYGGFFMPAFIAPSLGGGRVVDARSQLMDVDKTLEEAALDKYEFVRDAYLQRRRSLVHDGNPPKSLSNDEAFLEDTEPKHSVVVEYTDPVAVKGN